MTTLIGEEPDPNELARGSASAETTRGGKHVPAVAEDALAELTRCQEDYGRKLVRTALALTLQENEDRVTPEMIRRVARRRPPAFADALLGIGPACATLAIPLAIQSNNDATATGLYLCLAFLGIIATIAAVVLKLRH